MVPVARAAGVTTGAAGMGGAACVVTVGVGGGTLARGMGGAAGADERKGCVRICAIGAGVGAIGGSILTGGSTAGTVGGAAVGGVIGHEVNKK